MPYSVLHDELLLRSLHWREIEDMYLLQMEPRRDFRQRGLLNLDHMDSAMFYRSFRFQKADLDDLMAGLLIPEEVESAQRVRVAGREALCMALRRLADPNRLCDLEVFFSRHSSVISSVVSKVLSHIEYHFGHLLADLTVHRWLNVQNLQLFSQAVHRKGAPLEHCWAFISGTAQRISQPSSEQQEQSSGHRLHHNQKYQAVMCPNGMICQLDGPFRGQRRNAGILKETALYRNLEKVTQSQEYVIYGGPTYPLLPLLLKPFEGTCLQPHEALFNRRMGTVQQAVEVALDKVAADFAFVDFQRNKKMTHQNGGRVYKVATLLSNCRTCIYGSQVSAHFDIAPPSLGEYLVPSRVLS
ncbi:uncharacterized protein LOC119455374 [Dermacentor silvarum]|uniref:uncharacterized protein LOC119455374 n=1 Tax=Dermacentor silvarum TaxID=543639 RepID=UPI00189B000A|nr:uncharacterized protein LOC119455374 [Dermacentor silvarum]